MALLVNTLIVDLDNTLFPTRSVPEEVFAPVVDRVREFNRREKRVRAEILEQVIAACWDHPFDIVAAEHSLPDMIQDAWHEAMKSVEVAGPLEPYSDVEALRQLSLQKYLVTTGYRSLQESKIDALGIRSLFDGIYIDALGEGEMIGKEVIFKRLLAHFGGKPEEIAVIGDSPDSEIAAGNALRMRTVQVLRDGVTRAANADYHVGSLWDLEDVLE